MINLSISHYRKAIKFYLIIYLALSFFMLLLPLIESDFWLLYLAILGVLFIIILPFLLAALILIRKTKKALDNQVLDARVVGFESGFSIIPMPRLSLKLKTRDGRILITNSVINPKNMQAIKGHEVQVAVSKKNKIFLIMIF